MKPSIFYRAAAGLLLLFAAGHTFGFSQVDPAWHADGVVNAMRGVRFDAMGSGRTFWDLFLATGYSVGIFFLFSAILAWQLGRLPEEMLARLRIVTWAFALAFVALRRLAKPSCSSSPSLSRR